MKRYSQEMIVVAAVFESLMRHQGTLDTVEGRLVVDALRRSSRVLSEASLADLGDYLSGLDTVQLRGVANNVKGIYHELRFVHDFNETHTDLQAEVFAKTNHPDSDVLIRDTHTHEVVQELQLKASDSRDYALHDFDSSSPIERLATHEVASVSPELGDSGYSDSSLETDVADQFAQTQGLSSAAHVIHCAETSSLVSAALHGYEILQGRATAAEATKRLIADVAIATGTTALVALLFS